MKEEELIGIANTFLILIFRYSDSVNSVNKLKILQITTDKINKSKKNSLRAKQDEKY